MKFQRLCNHIALGALLAACSAHVAPKTPNAGSLVQAPLPPGSVARAISTYQALGVRGYVAEPALAPWLGTHHVVCLGEQHDNVAHHALQLALVRTLLQQAAEQQRPLAIGFEMFSVADQTALDDYAASAISEAELLARTNYAQRFGYDFEFYRGVLEAGRASGVKLLALNAPREWTRAVAQQGLAGLHTVNADLAPKDLVLDDGQHQHFFLSAMAGHAPVHGHGHGHGHANVQLEQNPMYMAQVVWDETMARSAARWLATIGPEGRVVVLAGAGHCHRSALPRRMERRLPGVRTLGVRLLTRSDMQLQVREGYTAIPANSEYELLVIADQ